MDLGSVSNIGLVRHENQDRVAILNNGDFTFLILCDGMGGHFGGALASSTTITIFSDSFLNNLPKDEENNLDIYIK
ncbi:UNVERIFIED_CONTAM: hypothetical protein O8I53_05570 [Campylobacter lari]